MRFSHIWRLQVEVRVVKTDAGRSRSHSAFAPSVNVGRRSSGLPALSKFNDRLTCSILLPDDALRGSVDAEADAVAVAAYCYVADPHVAEAVALTAVLRLQGLCVLIECDDDRTVFGSQLVGCVGQGAIKLLGLRGGAGSPCRDGDECGDDGYHHQANFSYSHQ